MLPSSAWFALVAFLSSPAAAAVSPSPEALAAGAAEGFALSAGAEALRQAVLPVADHWIQSPLPGKDDFDEYMREHSNLPPQEGTAAPAGAPASVDLASLLNRQWRTAAVYPMGGQTVTIGGAFDRQQNAFIGALVAGSKEPRFFNIRGLLDKEAELRVGQAVYGVSLSANILKPMKSQVVFENKADEDDQQRITVKRLLEALSASGETVRLSDQSYQAFYYNDIKEGPAGPAVDPATRTLAFLIADGDDIHVFLIPAELVPSDKVAVFKMYKNKRVG
ncbi:MAG: hypothetical protein HY554_13405, partial [Elusimicrobia bacterium]|nr:hypothetical protein [Elusimicrobiota bacterium]